MTHSPELNRSARSLEGAARAEHPHLLEHELARRWRLSTRTLQRWRQAGAGPVFLQLGHRIAYRLSDVERFEGAHERTGGWS